MVAVIATNFFNISQYMIFECPSGHICFSKNDINKCGMSGCNKQTVIISPIDIKWFYKINKCGLCINRIDLHLIIKDTKIPNKVKREIQKIFSIL